MGQLHYKLPVAPLFVAGVFILVLLMSWIQLGDSSIIQRFDAPIHDRLFRIRNNLVSNQPISKDVTLVGIDDYCYRKLGRFGAGKWLTRAPFITQINYFQNIYRPAVLAYDITFSEFEGESEKDQIQAFSKKELISIIQELSDLAGGDAREIHNEALIKIAKLTSLHGNYNLSSALSGLTNNEKGKTGTIVAYVFSKPEDSSNLEKNWSIASILGSDPEDYSEDYGTEVPFLKEIGIPIKYVSNLPTDYVFSGYATLPTNSLLDYVTLGYINVPRDEGGVVRRVPLIQGMEYKYIHPKTGEKVESRFFLPSMAFLSCLSYWGINLLEMNLSDSFELNGSPVLEIVMGKHITVHKPNGPPVNIPIDKYGNFFLDFVGWVDDFNSISFASVGPFRASEKAKEILTNKIALVGLTATGATDVGPTPIHDNTPFVFVHMMAISNILTETFILPINRNHSILILIAIVAVILPAASFFRPLRFSYITIILGTLYFAFVFYNVFSHKFLLPIGGPLLLFLGSYVVVVLYYYFSEEKEKKKIRGMFSTMVSGEVLEFLEDNPESFSLAGRKTEATMFFSDIAGFTSISESLSPEMLVELLNRYLSPMTEIILDSHGYVDKYEGDLIMAEWGIPYPNERHATLACWAALDQQNKIANLRPVFIDEFGIDIDVRMGLNSGSVSAGNMGSKKRFSYTVMGDAVNQAARFEPTNKEYGTRIIIGQSTYSKAELDIEARLLDKIIVKGKTIPIQIYELLAKKGELSEDMGKVKAYYQDGLFYHWERKWDKSLESFRKALKVIPADQPSQVMIKRVENYKESPPPTEWNGAFIRAVKD